MRAPISQCGSGIQIKKAVELKVNLDIREGKNEFMMKFLVVDMDHDMVLGFNFINGGDISIQQYNQSFTKYFKDSINSSIIYKTSTPLYKNLDSKFKQSKPTTISVGNRELFKLTLHQTMKFKTLEWIPNSNNTDVINNDNSKNNIRNNTNINSPTPSTNEKELIDKKIKLIMERFKSILIDEVSDDFRPITRVGFDMEIKVKEGSEPIKRNYGRRSEEEFKKLKEEAEKLLRKGIIEESNSDYSCTIFRY
ncbi:hypothetical protein ACTFIW_005440 [Dictyostelium discoideum]